MHVCSATALLQLSVMCIMTGRRYATHLKLCCSRCSHMMLRLTHSHLHNMYVFGATALLQLWLGTGHIGDWPQLPT
jgi:hypothetical protein